MLYSHGLYPQVFLKTANHTEDPRFFYSKQATHSTFGVFSPFLLLSVLVGTLILVPSYYFSSGIIPLPVLCIYFTGSLLFHLFWPKTISGSCVVPQVTLIFPCATSCSYPPPTCFLRTPHCHNSDIPTLMTRYLHLNWSAIRTQNIPLRGHLLRTSGK